MGFKEHVLHLRRHLAARPTIFAGRRITVPGTSDKALVGKGVFPDGEAHLQASEYLKAEKIGATLYLPDPLDSVLLACSPSPRAVETALYCFKGMCSAYAVRNLAIGNNPSSEQEVVLSEKGLDKNTTFQVLKGLTEPLYKNSKMKPDGGNELVAEAFHHGKNPHFPGYRWIVQKGFENDPRSEPPGKIAERALKELIPLLLKYDLILATTHQPNIEIITGALIGKLGDNGNQLFTNAGGAFECGDGLELRIYERSGHIVQAKLCRQTNSGFLELPLSLRALKKYETSN